MSLKDRLKNKKAHNELLTPSRTISSSLDETQPVEFNISIRQLTKKILQMHDNANLGAVVKEFSKFLDTLSNGEAYVTLNGNFDIGKKALISCLIANITNENEPEKVTETEVQETQETQETQTADNEEIQSESTIVKKRKSLKEKLEKAQLELDKEDSE